MLHAAEHNRVKWSDQIKSDAQLALLDLGIDLPFSRWRDACKYIRIERERALVDVRRDTLELLYLAKAKRFARIRVKAVVNGDAPVGQFDTQPTRTELIESKLWFVQTFGRGDAI